MKQAIHIFRKDARYVRLELVSVLLLAAVYAAAAIYTPNSVWAELLLAIAAAYLIARLVHAETIPGDQQFWLTRPYDRRSLLAAKLLGIAVFANLPIFVARFVVLAGAGFPARTTLGPLLWSQFAMLVGAMLPVAALAAVTRGFVSFTFSALILVAIGLAIDSAIIPPSLPAVRLLLGPSQWIWHTIALLGLICAAVPVLWLQYQKRKTSASRIVIALTGVALTIAYVYVPWPVAAAAQASVIRERLDVHGVQIRFKPEAKQFFSRGMMWRSGVQIDVPLSLSNVPNDVEPIPDGAVLEFVAADGTSWQTGQYIYPAIAKLVPGPGPATVNVNVDVPVEFFERVKAQPVRVRGGLYLTFFGSPQSATLPIQTKPVSAPAGLMCRLGAFQVFSCAAPFRWPSRLIFARFDSDSGPSPLTRVISYSPFPSGPGFGSFESRYVSVPAGARSLTIMSTEPVASARVGFEIENFPISAFGLPVRGSRRAE